MEKTLESPLDCKEIQLVHSEGDQPWDFFGKNDAEAETETPVLWLPHRAGRARASSRSRRDQSDAACTAATRRQGARVQGIGPILVSGRRGRSRRRRAA